MKKLLRLLILIIYSLLIFLFCIMAVVAIRSFFSDEFQSGRISKKNNELYKTLQLNPKTNERTVGFAKTRIFGDDNFLSFIDNDGNLNLVSKFEDDEYLCSGVCLCEYERRTAISKTISKGLMVLVAATSVPLALNLAKNTIQTECENEHFGSCEHIRSEVGECELALSETNEREEKVPQFDYEGIYDDYVSPAVWGKSRMFICRGNCLKRDYLIQEMEKIISEHHYMDKFENTFLKKRLDKVVEQSDFDCESMELVDKVVSVSHHFDMTVSHMKKVAGNIFRMNHLLPFCRDLSATDIVLEEKRKQKYIIELPLCTDSDSFETLGKNPTIECTWMPPDDFTPELMKKQQQGEILYGMNIKLYKEYERSLFTLHY